MISPTYCDACGSMMLSREVNISWWEEKCGCGNIYTSHDPNYHERQKRGREKHYQQLTDQLPSLQGKIDESEAKGEDATSLQDWKKRIQRGVEQFRQEEKDRVSFLLDIGMPQEEAAQATPFGASLFEVEETTQ